MGEGEAEVAEGLARHVTPAGDGRGNVTRASSDRLFSRDGLGFADGVWTRAVSWLARNGISKQTGSRRDETSIAGCVAGWGQGAFSSRVFRKDRGIDAERLTALVDDLRRIADWQALHTLCGQIDRSGEKVVTPERLAEFFGGERPFFADLVERRRLLRTGELRPGEAGGPAHVHGAGIDGERSDRELMRDKSALWMLLRISWFMTFGGRVGEEATRR